MKKNKQIEIQNIKFTVGIPSYKSGQALIRTVDSLKNSEGVGDFEIIVVVNDKMNKEIEKQLIKRKVKIYKNKKNIGQTGSNNRIFKLTKTDYLIMTQDDVVFQKDTLVKLISTLHFENVDMVAPKFIPLKPRTLVERAIQFGTRVNRKVIKNWNEGDCYLASIGRCLGYKTELVKKFEIPNEVINCDAYYYFEAKRLNGKFSLVKDAIVNFRTPMNLEEHLKQVRKFVVSKDELENYLETDLTEEYTIPKNILVDAFFYESIKRPIHSLLYILITIYSRTRPKSFYDDVTRFWDVDKSTKEI